MSISLFNRLGKHDEAIGKYEIRKPSFFRRLTMDGLDAVPQFMRTLILKALINNPFADF